MKCEENKQKSINSYFNYQLQKGKPQEIKKKKSFLKNGRTLCFTANDDA